MLAFQALNSVKRSSSRADSEEQVLVVQALCEVIFAKVLSSMKNSSSPVIDSEADVLMF